MRLLKGALIATAALAAVSGTFVVASAYPPPKDHHSVDCDPGHVSANNGSCTVVFVDKEGVAGTSAAAKTVTGKAGQGQTVCFTVEGPGTVTPACTVTNSKGKATATYHAGTSVSCSGTDPDGSKAVIRGKEHADDAGAAQTKVRITCPERGRDTDTDAVKHPDAGTAASESARAKTTAAILLSNPSTSASGFALGAGILAFIVTLSVAITGRLRLRRLRR